MGYQRSNRVVFVNRFFYPDHSATSEMLSSLAFALSRQSFDVIVIASRLRYDNAKDLLPPRDAIEGVDIFRVKTSSQGRERLMGRMLDYISFYVAAGWRLWRVARRYDVIVAKTDPPLLSVFAACIAWLRGAKLVTWQQDLFPEIAEAAQLGGGRPARIGLAAAHRLRDWSLRRADANVAIGMGMAKKLGALGLPSRAVKTIPNWADGTLIRPLDKSNNALRAAWGLQDRFVVGYAGNLGHAHEIETVLAAMEILNRDTTSVSGRPASETIKFVFVGGGALRERLEIAASERGLSNVQFYPYEPRGQLASVLGAADVHLVLLNEKMEGLVLPSKIYAVAAAGRPAIFVGDRRSEIAQLLNEGGWGFGVMTGQASELCQRILQLAQSPRLCDLMGARARTAFEEQWDEPIAVARWVQLLSVLLGKSDQTTQVNAGRISTRQ